MGLRYASVVVVATLSIATLGLGPRQVPQPGDAESTPVGRLGAILAIADFDQDDDLPPALSFLEEIAPDQRFERLRQASITIADSSGSPVEVHITPGRVTVVSPLSISIVPNGTRAARSFDVTPATRVRAAPAPGAFQAVVPGDDVVVVADGSGAALLIAKAEEPRPASPTPAGAPASPAATPSASPLPAQR